MGNCLHILQKQRSSDALPIRNSETPSYDAAKTQFSKCKKRSNTLLLIGFKDPGVRNAP
jgi:hypothetical protein